ncbi:hypothetical protein [Nonomuraea sp. NPDC049504]|uniref:hypothetical protein n=1 Tax=Nonomuraea sp. NPDC049504 TaxID=3154729 RepID=UPI0034191DB6
MSSERIDLEINLEFIKRIFDQMDTQLESMSDFDEAYEIATRLAVAMRTIADRAAMARAKSAAKISESEQLSLQGLADKLGISKSRAAQLLRNADHDQSMNCPELKAS